MEKVILKFNILYKNGIEDVIEQPVTEENYDDLNQALLVIRKSMKEGINGHLTLGDENSNGNHIRLSEIVRIRTEIIDGVCE